VAAAPVLLPVHHRHLDAADAVALLGRGGDVDVAEPERRRRLAQHLDRHAEVHQCAERHVARDAGEGIEVGERHPCVLATAPRRAGKIGARMPRARFALPALRW